MNIHFTIADYVQLITAGIIAVGGPTVVIIGLAKYFGDFLSNRLLIGVKNKHEKELEGLKNKYQKELESTKSDLEKTKTQFLRYSEKQFELYNNLWGVLISTRDQADSLWNSIAPEKIPAFSEQIRQTRRAVDSNMLLIEESHYKKLQKLLGQFEQFRFGKVKLIDILPQDFGATTLTQAQVDLTIKANKVIKRNYDNLIMDIGKTFRKQIKG